MAALIFFPNLFFCLLLCLISSLQGRSYKWEERYPFIKEASTFSSPSTSINNGDKVYDYIIVGGGTAGCPLAATLSQNYTVLLLERGGVPFSNVNVSFLSNFHLALSDLSSTSVSQFFTSTDGVLNSRARVLGGGSSINAGFYSRASASDIKNVGWDAKLVNESFPWIEKQIVHQPKLGLWQTAVRDGLLGAGISPYNGFTFDHMYGTKVGGTIFDKYDRRHTAAELLSSANVQNLNVLIHATVQNIMFDTSGKKPKAVGVIFKDENGNEHRALVSNKRGSEVILSSGAIGSPQMLLLSGIGPKSELTKLNIPVILRNKFVGKSMSDNPMNAIFVPTETAPKQSLIQTVGITKKGVYIEASSGFGQSTDSIRCNHGIVSADIGQLSTVPPNQRTKEAIQEYAKNKRDLPHEVFKGGFILQKIASPLSIGHLSLITANVNDNPNITFNYFKHPLDVKKCVGGIRIVEKLLKSKRFNYPKCTERNFEKLLNMSVKANVNLIPRHTNDTKSLEQFCKDTVITIWHYHGGCNVGKVVSSDYKVLGVSGLRVIDGSTFSHSPGTNPQATIMMLGRYMGVKILRHRLGKAAGV